MPPVLLNTLELADRLGEPYEHVSRWARAGTIPAITVGNKRYFNLKAVVHELRERQQNQPAEASLASA